MTSGRRKWFGARGRRRRVEVYQSRRHRPEKALAGCQPGQDGQGGDTERNLVKWAQFAGARLSSGGTSSTRFFPFGPSGAKANLA